MENETIEGTEQEAIQSYSRAHLVSFGNYLLSDEREERTSAASQQVVTHADLANWEGKETTDTGEGAEG